MQHQIEVRSNGTNYTAFCSCGWVGRDHRRNSHAEEDGDEHVLGATDDE